MLPNADPAEAISTYNKNRERFSYTYVAMIGSMGKPRAAPSSAAMTKTPHAPKGLSNAHRNAV